MKFLRMKQGYSLFLIYILKYLKASFSRFTVVAADSNPISKWNPVSEFETKRKTGNAILLR